MDTKDKLVEVLKKLHSMEEGDPRHAIYVEQKDKLEKELQIEHRLKNPNDELCESCQ